MKNCMSPAGHPTALIERLPGGVFFDILSRLQVTDLLECKLVSRFWHASIKDPVLATMHAARASKNNLCIILFSDWPKCKLQLVHIGDANENTQAVTTLKHTYERELPDFDVVGSCNGLVCLYNFHFDDPLFIYNPFTTEYRELPKLVLSTESNICRMVFGFGFHPGTKDYKVIKIVYYKQHKLDFLGDNPEAFVLTFSNPIWNMIGKIPYMLVGPASEAMMKGKLHWLTTCHPTGEARHKDIVSFDLQTEEFQVVPRPSCDYANQLNYHLVELQGCLSIVVSLGDGSNEIWVMKDYNVQESWTKQCVIGNYVPRCFRMDMAPPFRRKKNGYLGRGFRVLCNLENGDIVYLYNGRCLVSYNPDCDQHRDLNFQGLPLEFIAFAHVGSLVSVNTVLNM